MLNGGLRELGGGTEKNASVEETNISKIKYS